MYISRRETISLAAGATVGRAFAGCFALFSRWQTVRLCNLRRACYTADDILARLNSRCDRRRTFSGTRSPVGEKGQSSNKTRFRAVKGFSGETYIPTQNPTTQAQTGLSRTHVIARRSGDFVAPSRARTSQTDTVLEIARSPGVALPEAQLQG